MGGLPVVLLLCSFHALTAVAQAQQAEGTEAPGETLPANCREEMYPCTRMYSVHRPIKKCIGGLCLYRIPVVLQRFEVKEELRPTQKEKVVTTRFKLLPDNLPRVYVINNEICMRTVCQQDEYLKAELCRELSGWPRRVKRTSDRKRCRNRRSNPKTWANKA